MEEKEDENNRSIIMGIIDQLRKGTDLHRVSLPTFVLEPRSMCERLLDFFSFQYLLHQANNTQEPIERMIHVVSYFLSGWYTRPRGVKKPFNPILGEFFRTNWTEIDNSESFYICEQVSHHPPISAFVYCNPQNGIMIEGELRPRARFLGNSAATLMDGGSVIHLHNDEYFVKEPNMYARSILFGSMFMELGDTATIHSNNNSIRCSIDFKQQGFFGGSEKDVIQGDIFDENSKSVYKIKGKWSAKSFAITSTGKERVLFEKPLHPTPQLQVESEQEQEEFESRRLWSHVAAAVKNRDHSTATKEKQKIEDNQRLLVKQREANGEKWAQRFFYHQADTDKWRPLLAKEISPGKPFSVEMTRQFIYGKPEKDVHKSFWISQQGS